MVWITFLLTLKKLHHHGQSCGHSWKKPQLLKQPMLEIGLLACPTVCLCPVYLGFLFACVMINFENYFCVLSHLFFWVGWQQMIYWNFQFPSESGLGDLVRREQKGSHCQQANYTRSVSMIEWVPSETRKMKSR